MKYAQSHRSLGSALAHLFHPRRSNNHRARILHPEGYVVLGALAVLCFGLISYPTAVQRDMGLVLGYASDISVDQVVAQTNTQRRTAGLGAVVFNQQLAQAAQAKAKDMFAKQYWAHTSPAGREPWDFMKDVGYTYRRAGENLARDFMVTPEMIDAWMASPTHRANILNGGFSEIGVAVVNGSLEGVETTLVVQMFGAPPAVERVAQIVPAGQVLVEPADPREESTIPQPETIALVQNVPESPEIREVQNQQLPAVLAGQAVPVGSVESRIIYSPLHMAKAAALAIVILIISALAYDGFAAYSNRTVRLVGKNMAHICLFLTVAFILVYFKGGMIQ